MKINKPNSFISKYGNYLFFAIPVIVLLISISAFLHYVKDDAYITYRFSRNLINWGEIAFNRGIKVEGYTNFLWMIILTIPVIFKIDQLTFAKIVALLCSIGAVFYVWKISLFVNKDNKFKYIAALSAATLLASSTSFALWTMSGLENGLFLFLITAGLYYVISNRIVTGSVFLTLSCMTRPEGHLFLIVGTVLVIIQICRAGKISKNAFLFGIIPLVILGIYHTFRYLYFGSLFPNTFLVKGSPQFNDVFRINFDNGFSVEGTSVEYIKEFLNFNLNKFLVFFSFASLITMKKDAFFKNLFFLVIVILFFVYHIRIGKDSMIFYRLFLPALPFMAVLSVEGVKNIASLLRLPDKISAMSPVVFMLPMCISMVIFTHSGENSFLNNYLLKSKNSHQEFGKYLNEFAKQGDIIAFQDMGATPYIAENVTFFDTIGIVDPWMGRELSKINYNPFLRSEKMKTVKGRTEIQAFSRKFRDHLFNDINPSRVAFISYSPSKNGKNMSELLFNIDRRYIRNKNVRPDKYGTPLEIEPADVPEIESLFKPSLLANRYYYGLFSDDRFLQNYQLETYWRRTENYWIVLFKKKDIL